MHGVQMLVRDLAGSGGSSRSSHGGGTPLSAATAAAAAAATSGELPDSAQLQQANEQLACSLAAIAALSTSAPVAAR